MAYEKPPVGGYGSLFIPGKRVRINIVAIFVNIFLPWMMFILVFADLSFSYHYEYPTWCWINVGFAWLICFFCAWLAFKVRHKDRDPTWYTFTTIMMFIAVIGGQTLGDMNYKNNYQPYYDVQNLNTYPSVNPAEWQGAQVLDAGIVYFAEGTGLDMKKGMGFRDQNLYCVAPIVHGSEKFESYDFWAVGTNCCSGTSSDFRCGEFNNPHARSGLRLMRDEQRPLFALAVKQAEAAYNIKANRPVFFEWMQDPVGKVNEWSVKGFYWFFLYCGAFGAFNAFCVIIAVVGFSRIGRY